MKTNFILISSLVCLITPCGLYAGVAEDKQATVPNFVIIFTDDQGYGDLSCFGSTKIKTPHIDRMANEGARFTNFLVGASVCTPSRAALLTGCYPKTVGMERGVLFPDSTTGLHPDEHTIADHLQGQGYATACFGKWHLGHHPETLPTRQGFDEYYGIPYSNDMNHKAEKSEGSKIMWKTPDLLWKDQESAITKWNTPMMEGEKIIELPTDQRTITRRFTDKTIEFIKKNKDKPFFVYLAHSMPHIPLYVPDDVYDPDPKNAYTCVMEHLDAETGRLLDTLRETGLDKNTYVIFTSDNGPWIWLEHHAGSAGPLRGLKGETWEGGMRVPFVIWAPGRISAGTECHQLATALDLLPTIAALTDSELPKDRKIDGVDISSLLADPTAESRRKEFLYYHKRGHVEGIRQGDWKLLKKNERTRKGEPIVERILLFDLSRDIGEQHNVARDHPELVKAMGRRMTKLDAEVEQNARAVWEKPTLSNSD